MVYCFAAIAEQPDIAYQHYHVAGHNFLIRFVASSAWMFTPRMGSVVFQMNLANLIAFPLVFGILVGCGIHLAHRYREAPNLIDTLVNGSTVQAINLATFTTVIGSGSLLAAKHQGIYSLGLLMTVTLSIGWALSLVLLPAMLFFFIHFSCFISCFRDGFFLSIWRVAIRAIR
jgi:predicted RND superfamily exporter protein